MAYAFNPFTGNFDGTQIPDPLTINQLTVNTLLTATHIHGNIAGSLYVHVKNTSGGPLVKGTPVYAVGAVGDTTTLEVAAADGANGDKIPAIGLLGETLAHNASGHAVMFGEITGFNTESYQINDELYLANGGGLTATKPTSGYVQSLAIVGRVHANTGTILVWVASGSNAEIPVNTLVDGSARQLLQTAANGNDVEWTSNVDIPGTLDVTQAATFDSTVSVPLGTVSAPSIYPGSDTNTGFWSPGADTLAVSTNGVERIRVDNSQTKFTNDLNLDDGGSFVTTLQTITATANRVISLPDATGTVALVAGSSGQLLWNNAGTNAGASTLTYNGSILTTSGRFINSYTSLASAPAKTFTGSWFTGGTATTTKPHFLIEPTGATSTAWSTSGTGLGVNAATGFAGNLLDLQVNGTSYFKVAPASVAVTMPAASSSFVVSFGGSSWITCDYNIQTIQINKFVDCSTNAIRGAHRLTGTAPASATATGTAGDIRYDADFLYVCTATNTWKRAALSTW